MPKDSKFEPADNADLFGLTEENIRLILMGLKQLAALAPANNPSYEELNMSREQVSPYPPRQKQLAEKAASRGIFSGSSSQLVHRG